MIRTFCYLTLALLTCCTHSDKPTAAVDSITTTLQTEIPAPISDTISDNQKQKDEEEEEEEECVFNNDYKGLTTELLAELEIKNFVWRADLEQALVPEGQDTVFISKGGCIHFGLSVSLMIANDDHELTDSSFWINKTLDLATRYKMEHYEQKIRERKIRLAQSGETTVWFEVEDKEESDNLEYNGIEITRDGRNKRLTISQFYN